MRKLLDTACCQIQKPILLIAIGLVALLFWACQVGRSGWCNDEAAHIPAGLYHVETGRMDAYRVNPPLPRMIAAIPLLIDRPDVDWHYSESRYVRNEYQFAHQWGKDNHKDLCRHLILTRGHGGLLCAGALDRLEMVQSALWQACWLGRRRTVDYPSPIDAPWGSQSSAFKGDSRPSDESRGGEQLAPFQAPISGTV